jgi:radical SAM superfamily enzyme YgiQ (UPF0313 family)
MKILLINPPYQNLFKKIKGASWITPPLGLGYLASILEKDNHTVNIADMDGERLTLDDITENFLKERPELVGITAVTPNINYARNIADRLKKLDSRVVIAAGGPHPSVLPDEVISFPSIDAVIRGEGELTLREFAAGMKSDSRFEVPGTTQKKNGHIIKNADRPLLKDLNLLPFPARHLLNLKNYRHPLMRKNRVTTILTSRGCPYSCIYCNKSIFGNEFRARSAGDVLNEIEELINKYKIEEIHILDDTFNIDRERVMKICEGIIKNRWNIKWATPNGIRANVFDKEMAEAMKKSGCYSVSFGVESGNQKTLDYIKKNLDIPVIKQAFKTAHKAGLETVAFMIVGFPNETKEDIKKSCNFIKKLNAGVADFHTLIPLPGTEIYNYLKRENLILENDWAKYTFHDLPVFRTAFLAREEIARQYKDSYRSFHLRPGYIIKRLVKIRSWREIRNNLSGVITLIKDTVSK